jgi:hypothetical protein
MGTREEIDSLERDIRRAANVRVVLNANKMGTGDAPHHTLAIGPWIVDSQSTGVLAVGASGTVYLTRDGQAKGQALYGPKPEVSVERDASATQGGLNRVDGPDAPGSPLKLAPHSSYTSEWDEVARVWKVTVTNDSTSAADFLVNSRGVG